MWMSASRMTPTAARASAPRTRRVSDAAPPPSGPSACSAVAMPGSVTPSAALAAGRRGGANFRARAPRIGMDDERSTILIVEDDDATRTFLADNLCADGYEPL